MRSTGAHLVRFVFFSHMVQQHMEFEDSCTSLVDTERSKVDHYGNWLAGFMTMAANTKLFYCKKWGTPSLNPTHKVIYEVMASCVRNLLEELKVSAPVCEIPRAHMRSHWHLALSPLLSVYKALYPLNTDSNPGFTSERGSLASHGSCCLSVLWYFILVNPRYAVGRDCD